MCLKHFFLNWEESSMDTMSLCGNTAGISCAEGARVGLWPHLGSDGWDTEQPGSRGERSRPHSCAEDYPLRPWEAGVARDNTANAERAFHLLQETWTQELTSTLGQLAPGSLLSRWLPSSSVQGWTQATAGGKTEETWPGPEEAHTQDRCPSVHAGDNKAWLCVFYSFQYLSDPEGSLGHKVPWGQKNERRYKVDRDILSCWHQ